MKVGDLIKISMTGDVPAFLRDSYDRRPAELGIIIAESTVPVAGVLQPYWRILLTSGEYRWLYSDELEVQNESR